MSAPYLILALVLATFGLVIGFAQWSKYQTIQRMKNDDAPKSSLAKDGPGPNPIR